jgi:hypothetical protein
VVINTEKTNKLKITDLRCFILRVQLGFIV